MTKSSVGSTIATLAVALFVLGSGEGVSQAREDRNPVGRQEARRTNRPLPDGAELHFDGGDLKRENTITHITPPSDHAVKVVWDVSRVRGATAVLVEVARSSFGPDRDPDYRPRAIVSIERSDDKIGASSVSVGKIAREAGYVPPTTTRGRVARADTRQSFLQAGGHFSVHIRIVPIASLREPVAVGMASRELEIIYAKAKPPSIKIASARAPLPTQPSPVEVVSIKYVPVKEYCYVHPNKSVCAKVGQGKPWYEDVYSYAKDAWDWTCTAYQDAKNSVVDIAASALPFVPREVFAMALDGALVACGLPPNIPNLNELMEGGADYLAGELVAEIGPPVAGDLAKDQIKKAILAGAKAAAKKLGDAGPDTPCQYKIDWSYLIVNVRSTKTQPIGPLYVSVDDWTGIYATNTWNGRLFKSFGQDIAKLSPGAVLPVYVPLMPDMRQSKHYPGNVHKESVYWADYNSIPTEITIWIGTSNPSEKSAVIKTGKQLVNKGFTIKT